MITDTFENLSEEIIKVSCNDNAVKVDACILTFSHVILKYVLDNFECKKIGDLFSSNGANPVYGFEYENRYFAVYMSYIGAPSCVADIEDTMSIINTDKYVVFGGSGCLNKEIARGKVMVPTDAYRDEGTSYHYAPASDYIEIKNADVVAKLWKQLVCLMSKEKLGQRMLCIEKLEQILKNVKLKVVFLLKWNVQLFKLCVIIENLMYTSFLLVGTC